MEQDWSVALEIIKKHTFKILTPNGSGTGFLLTKRAGDVCGIATALHVVDHANQWEEPIKLINAASKSEVILHPKDRFIYANATKDCALILFKRGSLKTENEPPPLSPPDKFLKPGLQIGWAGYPAVAPNEFCFFTGNISCFLEDVGCYLVDGVAINGVSGGPAFVTFEKGSLVVIGIVSAYLPNRAAGEGSREAYDIDLEALYKEAAGTGTSLEINAFPIRLDLNDLHCRRAKELGAKLVINTDSHEASQLEAMKFGIAIARRGWLGKEDVINTLPVEKLLKEIKK